MQERSGELDVMVVGGASTDFTVQGARLPGPGESTEAQHFLQSPGGKGLNQAVGVARLGGRVALVARVGADARGHALVEAARREGVDVAHVTADAGAPTGAALVMVDARGVKQTQAALGANRRLPAAAVEGAAGRLACARVLLVQLEVPLAAAGAALRLARQAGVRTVLDPAPASPEARELLRWVDVVRPNAAEAQALTGVPVEDEAGARRAAAALLRQGAGAACVGTSAGNLLAWEGGAQWLPLLQVVRVDVTGAGDAFSAALALGLAEGRRLADAGAWAHAAAALTTTRLGAQPALPRRAELEAFLRR